MNWNLQIILCLSASGALLVAAGTSPEWQEFKRLHGKSYGSALEESFRKSVFLNNKQRVDRFNRDQAQQVGFRMGLNQFSDRSSGELLKNNSRKIDRQFKNSIEAERFFAELITGFNDDDLPDSVDWSQVEGRVSEVQTQGDCDSCYAFAAVGALEGQMSLRNATFRKLSVQNAIDCSARNAGCNGGWMDAVWKDIGDLGGIEPDDNYKYVARKQTCNFKKENSVFTSKSGYLLEKRNEQLLKKTLAVFGPVPSVMGLIESLYQYESGVYFDSNCPNAADHAILIVGYGTEPAGGDYWLIKNSWSERWGLSGFFKLARNRDNHCGIANWAMIPTF